MTTPVNDIALSTLIAARESIAPKLDDDTVQKCYLIQKKYQFSDDRSLSLAAMERLVEAALERRVSSAEDSK